MKSNIRRSLDELNTSFWFVPTLMTAIAIMLSFVTLDLDNTTKVVLPGTFSYNRGPDGARALLSAIASSVITVAGLTFSITIATLIQAASQFGSRLLLNFMRDKGNQLVLGTFVSTFIYCLLILRAVNGTGTSGPFVPHISVTIGLLLAVASIGVLIYFIHHMSSLLQADNVAAAASCRLNETINRIFPEQEGQKRSKDELNCARPEIPEDFDQRAKPVIADKSGYVQTIDFGTLLHLATECNSLVQVKVRPGDFVIRGRHPLVLWYDKQVDNHLHNKTHKAFFIGPRRTMTQDIEFAILQLVEIAVRALSPGINDPFTAMNCTDWLGQAISHIEARGIPSSCFYDKKGKLRVISQSITYQSITNAAFDPIRQAARPMALVTLHLLETIATLATKTANRELHTELLRHARLIDNDSEQIFSDDADRQTVKKLTREIALGG